MLSRETFEQEIARIEHTIHIGQSSAVTDTLKSLLRQHRAEPSQSCQVYYLLAQVDWTKNEFLSAKRHIDRCLKVITLDNPIYFKAKILAADILIGSGNLAGALKISLELLQQSDPNQQSEIFALAYLGIGNFYLLNNEDKRALVCQRHAYAFAKQSRDITTILKSALHLLQSLTSKKEFSESLDIISFCWNIMKEGFTDPAWIAELHHYTGLCFIESADFDRATESLNQSLTIHTREKLLWGQTQNRIALAELYAKKGDLKQACSMLESTILLASSFDQGFLQKKICLQLRDLRVRSGDFAAALAAQETYHRIEVSYQNKISKNIKHLSQSQLAELDKKQELIIIKLENKSLQYEIQQLKAQLNYQKTGIELIPMPPERRAMSAYPHSEEHQPIWGYLFSITNLIEINKTLGDEVGESILVRCNEILLTIRSILTEQVLTWFRYSGQHFILLSPIHPPKNLSTIFDEAFNNTTWPCKILPTLTLISAPIQLHQQAIQTLINSKTCWAMRSTEGVNHAPY